MNLRTIDATVAADTSNAVESCGGAPCSTLGVGEVDVVVAGVGGVPATGVVAVNVAVVATAPVAGSLVVGRNGVALAGGVSWTDVFNRGAANFTVPVNTDGTITVDATVAGTGLLMSVSGYWATPTGTDTGAGLVLGEGGPQRLVDTATGVGVCGGVGCGPLTAFEATTVAVTGRAGVPQGADAILVSITTGQAPTDGLMFVGADDTSPAGLMLFEAGRAAHATMIVPLSANGTIEVVSWTAIDVSIDVIGWFEAPTVTWDYEYSPTGQRTAKQQQDGPRFEHTWNNAQGLPLLLAEHRGGDTSYLVYGPAGTPIYQITANGQPFYYHQDHQGTTRLTTGPGGHTRGTHTYTAQGAPQTNTTGWLQEQPLAGYTGQYHDHETGHIHLRARQYDPTTAQFTSLDPLVTVTEEPYGYVGGNPANVVDPSGQAPSSFMVMISPAGASPYPTASACDAASSPQYPFLSAPGLLTARFEDSASPRRLTARFENIEVEVNSEWEEYPGWSRGIWDLVDACAVYGAGVCAEYVSAERRYVYTVSIHPIVGKIVVSYKTAETRISVRYCPAIGLGPLSLTSTRLCYTQRVTI